MYAKDTDTSTEETRPEAEEETVLVQQANVPHER